MYDFNLFVVINENIFVMRLIKFPSKHNKLNFTVYLVSSINHVLYSIKITLLLSL